MPSFSPSYLASLSSFSFSCLFTFNLLCLPLSLYHPAVLFILPRLSPLLLSLYLLLSPSLLSPQWVALLTPCPSLSLLSPLTLLFSGKAEHLSPNIAKHLGGTRDLETDCLPWAALRVGRAPWAVSCAIVPFSHLHGAMTNVEKQAPGVAVPVATVRSWHRKRKTTLPYIPHAPSLPFPPLPEQARQVIRFTLPHLHTLHVVAKSKSFASIPS